MRFTKILGPVAAAALAMLAFTSIASATTLSPNGTRQTGAVSITATASGSLLWQATGGGFLNTCTTSAVVGTTNVFTGTVSAPLTNLLFSSCTSEPVIVDSNGSLSIDRIGSTLNGTLRSSNTKVTVPSPFGLLPCTTSNTDLGTLTGTSSGISVMDINAVINCGFLVPSAQWTGTYKVTGHSLAVEA